MRMATLLATSAGRKGVSKLRPPQLLLFQLQLRHLHRRPIAKPLLITLNLGRKAKLGIRERRKSTERVLLHQLNHRNQRKLLPRTVPKKRRMSNLNQPRPTSQRLPTGPRKVKRKLQMKRRPKSPTPMVLPLFEVLLLGILSPSTSRTCLAASLRKISKVCGQMTCSER